MPACWTIKPFVSPSAKPRARMEADVESALARLIGDGVAITSDAVKVLVAADARPTLP